MAKNATYQSDDQTNDHISRRIAELIKNKSATYKSELLLLLEKDTPPDQRAMPRRSCFIPVDYTTNDHDYHDFIQNMSDGGLFVETRAALTVGQQIALTFSLPHSNHQTRITGEIVWVGTDGFGVNLHQPIEPAVTSATATAVPTTSPIEKLQTLLARHRQNEARLQGELKEKNLLLRELQHRLKNNFQLIYSIINLQMLGAADSAVEAILCDTNSRIKPMAEVHKILSRTTGSTTVELKSYLEELVQSIFKCYQPPKTVQSAIAGDELPVTAAIATACGMIVNELVTNSIKYAFPDGRPGHIGLKLDRPATDEVEILVTDNGVGSDTEAACDDDAGMGLKLVSGIVHEQLHGRVMWSHESGFHCRIRFSAAKQK